MFLFAVYGITYHEADLWHYWMPISVTDDEVMYNRQLVGALTEGQPHGYFGYNETSAPIGHFGAWGAVLIYLYALPGLLFGAGVNTMLWCNLFFAVLGWTLFVLGTRSSWKHQLAFAAGLVCLWFPLREVYTGMAEPLQYACVLAFLGAAAALRRAFSVRWYLVLAVSCALTTITRAYTGVLWLLPVLLLWKTRRHWAVGSLGLAALSLAGYQAVSTWFSSPYFSGNGMDFTAAALLLEGKVGQAFRYEGRYLAQQLSTLWDQFVAPTLSGNPQEQGGGAIATVLLLGIVLVCLAVDIRQKKPVACKAVTLLCAVATLLLMVAVYDVGTLHRHCALLNLLLFGALMLEDFHKARFYLPLMVLLLPVTLQPGKLPTYRADMDAQIQTVRTALVQAQKEDRSEDPWDSTLAYAYADGVYHGYLYGVPAGMGIEFDWNTYLADPTQPVYARYAMVNHGTGAETRLAADGWQQLVSTEALVVYERPDSAQ